ncbi:MAG: recombinase family protein [Candidatus Hydrogenedentes bacterium]|nr:recombinase family protein [Candidatus Hydrogenedentota bacterium]
MSSYFAYVRVSTARQGEHGVSLEEQRAAISDYAQKHDLQIVRWFEERLTAAKRGRPIFNQMVKLIRQGDANGLVIHAIDRGVRNLWDWASLGELLDEGKDVRFVRDSVDLQGRGGRLAADIQAVVAADYVRNLKEETLKGFYGRLKQGYYPLKAPLGYLDHGSGQLKTICPVKGPLVRQAFERYASGKFTLGTLAEELYYLGLRNGWGSKFSDNGLSAILNNPFYVGLIRIRKTNEMFTGAHEALVSKSLYDRVQSVLHGRTQKRVRKHDFLYRGLLKCSECERYLVGERQRGHVYYRCHQKHESPCCFTETQVTESIQRLLGSLKPTDIATLSATEDFENHQTVQPDRAALEAQLDKVTRRLGRLAEIFHEGSIDADLYRSRQHAYLLEKVGLEERLKRLVSQDARQTTARNNLLTRAKDFAALSRSEQREVARILLSAYGTASLAHGFSKTTGMTAVRVNLEAA